MVETKQSERSYFTTAVVFHVNGEKKPDPYHLSALKLMPEFYYKYK